MTADTSLEVAPGVVINARLEADVPAARLLLHPANPRRGDIDDIRGKIRAHGFYGVLTVQSSTGRICVGNHRYQAGLAEGIEAFPVAWVDIDDDTALELLIADNDASDKATNDADRLLDILGHLSQSPRGISGTGFTPDALQKMLAARAGNDPSRRDPDEEELTLPYTARTVSGDLWQLGPHRVLCGDARIFDDVARLMDGQRAGLVFTSPPYNVGVEYESHDDTRRPWDLYREFLRDVLLATTPAVIDGGAFCWNIGVSPKTFPHRQMVLLEECGLTYVRSLVWEKVGVPVPSWYHTTNAGLARTFTPNYKHELVLVYRAGDQPDGVDAGDVVDEDDVDLERALAVFTRRVWDPTPAHDLVLIYANGDELARGGAVTASDVLQHDVFRINQTAATIDIPTVSDKPRTGAKSNLDRRSRKAHPAPFPVALPEAFITALADLGEPVLDPFAGAGATILAAARQGRIGYGLELDPSYVDIICWRYQRMTGDLPIHAGTGRAVDFTQPLDAPGGAPDDD